jgi:Electron transfer DM13
MKKLSICLTIVLFNMLMISCSKEEEIVAVPTTEVATGLTALFQGTFAGASHPTSGTVKLSKDAAGKKFLVFENFKTDAGPDLRIYLSDDLKATNFTEITNKVASGTFQVPVDAAVNTDTKRKVLIWCKQFTVLFGSADLK